MINIFLDTDVIIDYLTDRKPFADSSEQIFALIENNKIRGHASSLCFSNLYYLLKQQMSRQKVIALLKSLSEIINIIKVDEDSIHKAIDSDFKDFEDAIQYYSLIDYKRIDAIVTRNIKDYKLSELSVFSPDSFLQSFRNQWG
ncbi:type II toxin-antitoxin system VapC family toxin [Bacteroidota bacterium]